MDFDDAYANAAYIPDGDRYPVRWAALARRFRDQARGELDVPYGESPRQRFDLFYPQGAVRGVVVFVHGGYWRQSDKSYWSHLAQGCVAQGWVVAMPSYDLCPQVRIAEIGQQIAQAIGVIAMRVSGPIRLAGHSAGGQLVALVAVRDDPWVAGIVKVVPISPIGNLAPLMHTDMNRDLRIDSEEVVAESPIHLPRPDISASIWVGGAERPAFLTQAAALADVWGCEVCTAEKQHHFNVIEGLTQARSDLVSVLLGA